MAGDSSPEAVPSPVFPLQLTKEILNNAKSKIHMIRFTKKHPSFLVHSYCNLFRNMIEYRKSRERGTRMDELIQNAKLLEGIIEKSRHVVFFGGAGVSVESGIPDFRSVDGLYNEKWKYPPETVLSRSFFDAHTEDFYAFYREKMIHPDARPNPAHIALAEWERKGKAVSIVTQNIDGLHQVAGSHVVHELHGSVHRNACMYCGAFYDLSAVADGTGVPRCACGGVIKPRVVLYEEALEDATVTAAVDAIASADTMIIAGTSLRVYPAAGLVRYFRGKNLVYIDPNASPMEGAITMPHPVGKLFEKIHIT